MKEREKDRMGLGSVFIGYGWRLRVSQAHSLLVDLKYRVDMKKKKQKQVTQMVSYRNQPRSLKQRSLNEGR